MKNKLVTSKRIAPESTITNERKELKGLLHQLSHLTDVAGYSWGGYRILEKALRDTDRGKRLSFP